METIYEGAKETAKKIRVALKETFPGVKFSVRSQTYSGGSSVNVSWTDLPLKEDVEEVVNRFKSGSFDGMTDMYETSGYIENGVRYVGAKYISCSRELSDEYRAEIETYLHANYEVSKNHYEYYRYMNKAEKEMIEAAKQETTQEEASETIETVQETNAIDVTLQVELNEKLNGIELYFSSRPSQNVRKMLSENGFRWSKRGFWYARQSEERLSLVEAIQSILAETNQLVAEVVAETQELIDTEETNTYNTTENDNKTVVLTSSVIPFPVQSNTLEMDLQYFAEIPEAPKSMNMLLSKFSQVEIKNESRISQSDQEYCEEQEKMFKEAKKMLNIQIGNLKTINKNKLNVINEYYNYDHIESDIRSLEKRMSEFKDKFISNVISHFRKQYNVTLESGEVRKKYNIDITYINILDEIFEQLGGFNFKEKAEQEIKDKLSSTIYRGDKIKINKNKLSINDFVWWDTSWDNKYKQIGYNDRKVTPLFNALSYFETESTEQLNYYINIYDQFRKGEREYDIFSKYELGYNKVNSIKFYKNGKVDIEFQSNQQAQEFHKEYLTK